MKIFSVFIVFFFIFTTIRVLQNRNLEPLQIPKLACGQIESLKLKIEIPFNCESEVWIPNGGRSSITESGKAIASKKEITLLGKEGDSNVYRTGSGNYFFDVRYPAEKF